jgi:hypothetical protein
VDVYIWKEMEIDTSGRTGKRNNLHVIHLVADLLHVELHILQSAHLLTDLFMFATHLQLLEEAIALFAKVASSLEVFL